LVFFGLKICHLATLPGGHIQFRESADPCSSTIKHSGWTPFFMDVTLADDVKEKNLTKESVLKTVTKNYHIRFFANLFQINCPMISNSESYRHGILFLCQERATTIRVVPAALAPHS
jgi:hypothetical protein